MDLGHDLEAIPLIKGNIERVRRPEICRAVLQVVLTKTVLQQDRPVSLVPVQSFNADERQIAAGLGWR